MEGKLSFVDLITSGAAFGGSRRHCHPKMLPFVHEVKKSYCMINLNLTNDKITEIAQIFQQLRTENKKVLFVGTKLRIRKVLSDLVEPSEHYYVNYRWLGGLLTNFEVLSRRIETLQKVRQLEEKKTIEAWSKREQMMFRKNKYRLERTLRGIAEMQKLPDCLVLIDPKTELTALAEAEKLGIPVYALTSTEINPDRFTNFIPLNDNSERAVKIVLENLFFHLVGQPPIEPGLNASVKVDVSSPVASTLEAAPTSKTTPKIASTNLFSKIKSPIIKK